MSLNSMGFGVICPGQDLRETGGAEPEKEMSER